MHRLTLRIMVPALLALALAACPTAPDPTPPDEPEVDVTEGMLDGPSDDLALEHTVDLDVPRQVDEAEVSDDPDIEDRRVLRTEIEVLFVEDVTVGEVNTLLAEIDGQIVGMTQGVPSYVIRIPDPGDLESLRELIEEIIGRDEVLLVLESVLVQQEPVTDGDPDVSLQVLPPGLGVDAVDRVDHHLAARGHAAWNARLGLPSLQVRPWFLIADLFGDGPPNADFDAGLTDDDFADVFQSSAHGYHVLGIATGYFGNSGEALARNRITGMFPSSLRVRGADIFDNAVGSTWSDLPVKMINRMQAVREDNPAARIVINTSLNSRALSDTEREQRALLWAWRLRSAGLEDGAVHLTSAGNISTGATWPAEENSIFSKAALSDTQISVFGITLSQAQLTNTMVVENRVNTPAGDERPRPGCLNGSNFNGTQLGGTVSAMGTGVWSFIGPQEADGTNAFTGTSMATPQVAAVAAFVWSLDPTLSSQGVIDVILDSSRSIAVDATPGFVCHDDTGTPVIDAYDAVLAAGGESVRRTILDVTGSGSFTEQDIARYLAEYDQRAGALDFSRYDLNGAGNSGGPATDRFDLNMSGTFGIVTQQAAGTTLVFDEETLTDTDVLCYYAFSDLYEGDTNERFELLAAPCGILPELIIPPGGIIIRTIDPGVITIDEEEHDTLPQVEYWTEAPESEVLAYYEEVLENWTYIQWRTADVPALLHYFFEEFPEDEAHIEESAQIAPAVLIRNVIEEDGLPAEASTYVRVTYGEAEPGE